MAPCIAKIEEARFWYCHFFAAKSGFASTFLKEKRIANNVSGTDFEKVEVETKN